MNRDKIMKILNRLTEHKATEYIIGLYTDEILALFKEQPCRHIFKGGSICERCGHDFAPPEN